MKLWGDLGHSETGSGETVGRVLKRKKKKKRRPPVLTSDSSWAKRRLPCGGGGGGRCGWIQVLVSVLSMWPI